MTTQPTLDLVDAIASQLADPDVPRSWAVPAYGQHLAYGPPGIALLHIELAARGLGPWQRAHDWLAAASRQPLTSGPDSHPFYGAPALAHALACAADRLPGAYQSALDSLDRQIVIDVRRRLEAAHRRFDAGRLPQLADFDAIRGLTGYGAYLLRRSPDGTTTRAVLDYCVRLIEPLTDQDETLPGWWTETGPSGNPDDRFPGGHANHGMAHGIGGVLALLALAARRGAVVSGHHAAMRTILTWLDRWETGPGQSWPYWIARDELRTGCFTPSVPRRPSWCYGTAGLARAQQLAGLALGDTRRRVWAENALMAALADADQLKAITDNGLCHGFAGLAHLAARVAEDAHATTVDRIRAAIPAILDKIHPPGAARGSGDPGLLDGAAGVALALIAPSTTTPSRSSWDSCLLIA
ncbi:lanthionine synthetase C family protein [Streptomyces jumonjinensis]|uniref:lanthionine synthetase C family protein n=1 Tax=Streptomyces jumonjinensis TaxID=1945 RepID=UPI0037935FE0